MNLLEDEVEQTKKRSNKKNKILVLLIISIILLVFALTANSLLPKSKPRLTLEINEKPVETKQLIYENEQGGRYISLKQLSELVGYNYFKGEYNKYSEDENKCYLDFGSYIVGFEVDSNEIYKTKINSNIEYQRYNLKNKIIVENNELYISLDDLAQGCNLMYVFNEISNKIKIQTPEFYIEKINSTLTEESKYKAISDNSDNNRVIAYDLVVVQDKNDKFGVMDLNLKNEKIGFKYEKMEFDEYTQNFIVSTNGKYGIISKDGKLIFDLKYEDISIIKYSPLMYSAKIDGKYGVIDERGKIIVQMKYDSLGYSSNKTIRATSTIIIKNLKNNEDGIIVKENGKYGIINLETGKLVGERCELDGVYSKTDKEGYFVMVENTEFKLEEYLEYANTENVNIS